MVFYFCSSKRFKMEKVIFIFVFTISTSAAQVLVSPCPSLFNYRPLSWNSDIWIGDLTITSQTELSGIWIRIVFDKPPLEVDSDFGEIAQRESNEYLIRQPDKRLKTGEKQNIVISVKFDKNSTPPELLGFRLNARVICPENGVIPKPEETIDLRTGTIEGDLISPCPDVFDYEPFNNTGIWFGNIKFKSDKYYSGVTIKVVLDGQALQLGNWFGEVITPNNIEFTIRNPTRAVRKNENVAIRLFIKFKQELGVPRVKEISINNKAVCFVPDIMVTTTRTKTSEVPLFLEALTVSESPTRWESPCPSIFHYKPIGPNDDTWNGDLTISTETELSGVWLRIIFDSIPGEVSSDFGEVVQREATEYLIRRPEKGLKIGHIATLRITVKFDINQPPPKIIGIRLNARVICPENGVIQKPGSANPIEDKPVELFGTPTTVSTLPAVAPKLESPCPTIFQYEPLKLNDDTWYGGLTISTETELSGVWLRLVFDSPPQEVNSNFGEVVQRESTEYLIRRPEKGLKIKDKESLKLWVKFNTSAPIPKLVGIRLNARVICPENGVLEKPGEKAPTIMNEKYIAPARPIERIPTSQMQTLESSCPSIFKYRPFSSNGDTWTGDLTISATERISGISLTMTFDRRPIEVSSNFGVITDRGTKTYVIQQPNKILNFGEKEFIEITLKFDNNSSPPHLVGLELNKRIICPENIFMLTETTTEFYEQTTKRPSSFYNGPVASQSILSQTAGVSLPLPDILSEIPLEEIPDDPNVIDQKIVAFQKFFYIIQKYPQYSIIHLKRRKLN